VVKLSKRALLSTATTGSRWLAGLRIGFEACVRRLKNPLKISKKHKHPLFTSGK
jgi:hypothetical protein